MLKPRAQSLRQVLLGHELAFLVLVAVTGAMGAAWAYFWQQTSTESLRLNGLMDAAQDIQTLGFRQVKEVALARLREDLGASELQAQFYHQIQDHFNVLRQRSNSRAEDYAVQRMQEAYSRLQADMNNMAEDSFLLNKIVRGKLLDPRFEADLVQGFETSFKEFRGLIAQELDGQAVRIRAWTRYAPYIVPVPLVIALGVLVASRTSLARGFVRPMRAIMQGTQEMSAGNLDHRLPIEGVAEVAALATRINQMAIELAASRDAVIEAERQAAQGALVPVIAHNIRNPLASIRATAQLLEHTEDRAETTELGREIVQVVDRLGRWVSALVSYLHPLQPQLKAEPAAQLFEAVLELLKPRLIEKQTPIVREPWDPHALVVVDADLMEQAIYAVMTNALEASRPATPLTLAVHGNADTVTLSVTDCAGGIPFIPNPADLTPGPTTKRFGTGLGIPIAFKVCRAHGWTLEFALLDNAGTKVTFTAPRARQPS